MHENQLINIDLKLLTLVNNFISAEQKLFNTIQPTHLIYYFMYCIIYSIMYTQKIDSDGVNNSNISNYTFKKKTESRLKTNLFRRKHCMLNYSFHLKIGNTLLHA